ncbi:MAG: hypothetical protein AAF296_06075 [Pseudomonadota bacterium]
MRSPQSMKALEELGRVRLSPNFFFRDFLYSEISNFYGVPNIPDDPDTAILAASGLCERLLEPLTEAFGKISIRSGYRSPTLNEFGNSKKMNCGSNAYNRAHHIFDWRDKNGRLGATATIVVNAFIDLYEETGDWPALAWFIHDHLPYQSMWFYPKLAAFNLNWNEAEGRDSIKSYVTPKGLLTKIGMANYEGDHSAAYDYPLFKQAARRLRA